MTQPQANRRDRLWVDERSRAAFQRRGWDCFDAVVRYFTRACPQPWPSVLVVPPALSSSDAESAPVFFKLYAFAKPAWRFWLRASKARREYHNYTVFERQGVRCARRIACGESRDFWGRLQSAFILTQAVPGCVTLPEFFRANDARAGRNAVILELADMARRIHAAGFFHNDLYGRNILVSSPAEPVPLVYWIDCPRGHFARWSPARRRHLIKDLAALDLTAVQCCRKTERLRFLLAYLGQPTLDEHARRMLHEVLSYRQRRWSRPHYRVRG